MYCDIGVDIIVVVLFMDEVCVFVFGLMKIDGKGWIYEFVEKFKEDEFRVM